MRKAVVALALAGTVLAGSASLATAATYGVGDYYNFTRAYVGEITSGKFDTQPTFVSNPGNNFLNFSKSQFFPTISGMTVNIPVPAGSHNSSWWRSFTDLQIGRVTTVLRSAGVIGGGGGSGGGAGVPSPVAGAGLPVLALAAFALLRRRRGQALPAPRGNLLAA